MLLIAQTTSADVDSGSAAPLDVTDVNQLWETTQTWITEKGVDFGINVVAAIAIFIIGRMVAKMLRRIVQKAMAKGKVDDTLSQFLGNIIYALLLAFVVIAAINRLGVDTTSFAAIMAAAGLAIGLALQGSLSNFASGVMIILFKPFAAGDFVEAGGSAGVIEEIHIFSTILRTGDNKKIIIPNSSITGGTIVNYSAKDTRRIDLVFGCGYGDDLKAVKEYLIETVNADERVLQDPEPVVAVAELGDSSVNFVVRPWVKTDDYWPTLWDLTEKIKLGFDAKGFNIPYPTQDLHVHKESA